eukprot:6188744-Pleurochrysis_carterae.AAC.2
MPARTRGTGRAGCSSGRASGSSRAASPSRSCSEPCDITRRRRTRRASEQGSRPAHLYLVRREFVRGPALIGCGRGGVACGRTCVCACVRVGMRAPEPVS